MMIIPIGGADMPTVISLLNSYAGYRRRQWICAAEQTVDYRGGAGRSVGLILSVNMSKAMNRSFTNVLFGAFGQEPVTAAGRKRRGRCAARHPKRRQGF